MAAEKHGSRSVAGAVVLPGLSGITYVLIALRHQLPELMASGSNLDHGGDTTGGGPGGCSPPLIGCVRSSDFIEADPVRRRTVAAGGEVNGHRRTCDCRRRTCRE